MIFGHIYCDCLHLQLKGIGGIISTSEPRINDRIRVPQVRLIGFDGEQVGVVDIDTALKLADEVGLDLVEIAPDAQPPVCKVMDFGKYKYEIAQKAREARQNQTHIVVKEMRLRPKIEPHDYETKRNHIEKFLKGGDKEKGQSAAQQKTASKNKSAEKKKDEPKILAEEVVAVSEDN